MLKFTGGFIDFIKILSKFVHQKLGEYLERIKYKDTFKVWPPSSEIFTYACLVSEPFCT